MVNEINKYMAMNYVYKLETLTELEPTSIQHVHAPTLLAFQFIITFFVIFCVGLKHPALMFYSIFIYFVLLYHCSYLLQFMYTFLTVLSQSLHSINLLKMRRQCFTFSYLHLPFNFHYSHSQLSHAYLIMTQASLLTITHHVLQHLSALDASAENSLTTADIILGFVIIHV